MTSQFILLKMLLILVRSCVGANNIRPWWFLLRSESLARKANVIRPYVRSSFMINTIRWLEIRMLVMMASLVMTSAFASVQIQPPVQHLFDGHTHYVDFMQQSDDIQHIVAEMKANHVDDMVIMGLPVQKKWSAIDTIEPLNPYDDNAKLYYYSATDEILARAIESLPKREQKKFHPFICGFNPTDKNAVAHIERMMAWHPHLWQGIGEILTRHGQITDLTEGETATANHPALSLVYDYAAQHHLPVLIHSDISPQNINKDSPFAQQPLYLSEIEFAVASHPTTIFIWAHAGLNSHLIPGNMVVLLDALLAKYHNLYIDLADYPLSYMIKKGKVNADWLALMEKYDDRFIFGTDMVKNFSDYAHILSLYQPLMHALSEKTAQKVFSDNMRNLLKFT